MYNEKAKSDHNKKLIILIIIQLSDWFFVLEHFQLKIYFTFVELSDNQHGVGTPSDTLLI